MPVKSSIPFWRKDSFALWVIAIPAVLHLIIFKYVPLAGNVIAFQNYNLFKGFFHSPWIGLDNFERMFRFPEFFEILRNTLLISGYSIVFGFPAPLFLALLLNEVRLRWFKSTVQTVLFLPHFLSWVIVGGIFMDLFGFDGLLNAFLLSFGHDKIDFITEPQFFRTIIVATGIWKEAGWGMIVFLAALVGINPQLYEAAMIDGAGVWRRMWSISLPGILPAIVVLFLLRIGTVLELNVEQILLFLSPLTQDVGDVIDTYLYRVGLIGAKYSYTTAIGIFKSVIGLIFIVSLNQLSKRTTGESIY